MLLKIKNIIFNIMSNKPYYFVFLSNHYDTLCTYTHVTEDHVN